MPIWRRNLYILMISQFLVMGAMTMVLPFIPLYLHGMGMTDLNQTQLWTGMIFGINYLSALLVAPLWGRLADKYGQKMMILRSGFGMLIVNILCGFATSPVHLLLLRLLNGAVSGFVPATVSLIATNTPKERSGYALGMIQSATVAGAIVGPFLGGILAELLGYQMIFYLTGTVIVIATLVVLFTVKEQVVTTKREQRISFFADASRILNLRPLVVLFSVGFMVQFAISGLMPQMPLFISQLGAPGGRIAFFAGLVTAITGVADMIASPILGRLGDKYGSYRVMFFALLGAIVFSIPQAWVDSVWDLLSLRFLLGLCIAGIIPSLNALIRRFAPDGLESASFGYSNSANFLGTMLGSISAGYLSGLIGIRGLFLMTAGLFFMGIVLLHISLKQSFLISKHLPVTGKIGSMK